MKTTDITPELQARLQAASTAGTLEAGQYGDIMNCNCSRCGYHQRVNPVYVYPEGQDGTFFVFGPTCWKIVKKALNLTAKSCV